MEHHLKTWPEYLTKVKSGEKKFELRKDDRDYNAGDVIVLHGFDIKSKKYTQELAIVKISYILRDAMDFGLKPGFCLMSIDLI